tara:strand:- start:173 stop:886 length:714 start_codon:yes stop_codon:yes gene_type:complete
MEPLNQKENEKFLQDYLSEEIFVVKSLDNDKFAGLVSEIIKANSAKGTIFLFGNGGSASIASHFAHNLNWDVSADLRNGEKISALALNDNVSHLTGLANDRHYDQIFSEQLKTHLKSNDLVIGMSASGNSDNVYNGLKYARDCGNFTISISGSGGRIAGVVDKPWEIPSHDQQIVEDIQQIICHVIVRMLFYYYHGFAKQNERFEDIAHLRNKKAYLLSRSEKDKFAEVNYFVSGKK